MDRKTKYMPVWGRHVAILDKLSDEALGELFRGMMHYHFDETEPDLEGVLSVYWDFLKPDLDNARSNYEKKAESGRRGGKRSGEVRMEKKEREAELSKTKQTEQIESESETESKAESESETESESDTGFAPAGAGISLEKKSYGEFGWVKLTDRQYRQLQAQMGEQTLEACIRYVDRSAQSTNNCNRWKDWHLILRRCYEAGWHLSSYSRYSHKAPIPMGASGELGEAELEAIQRVLRE
jgi:hypothetical protein